MLLRLTAVNRTFASRVESVVAVDDLTLGADAGDFVCIFGASGSGKSTLLNLIAGLDRPDSGSVEVCGVDVAALDEDGRARVRLDTIGVVYQDHQLIEEFTAAENVALPLEVRGIGSAQALALAEQELARVGIGELRDRLPAAMSGGQRQRVGIARALIGERRVVLADEPTGSLDSVASRRLLELLAALCAEGALVVVCTHDELARSYANRIFRMTDGRLVPEQTPVVAESQP